MPLRAAETRGDKGLHQFPSESVTDHESAEADQVEIVILDALVRGKSFVNQTRADAGNFVGDYASTNPAATDGHAPIHGSAGNRTGQRHDKIRIIIFRLRLAVAEINDFITGFAQFSDQILLQLVTAVVGGDAEGFRCFFHTTVFSKVRLAVKTLALLAAANNGVNTP